MVLHTLENEKRLQMVLRKSVIWLKTFPDNFWQSTTQATAAL